MFRKLILLAVFMCATTAQAEPEKTLAEPWNQSLMNPYFDERSRGEGEQRYWRWRRCSEMVNGTIFIASMIADMERDPETDYDIDGFIKSMESTYDPNTTDPEYKEINPKVLAMGRENWEMISAETDDSVALKQMAWDWCTALPLEPFSRP